MIPPQQLRLFFAQRLLQPHELLSAYKVYDGATLYLTVVAPGAKPKEAFMEKVPARQKEAKKRPPKADVFGSEEDSSRAKNSASFSSSGGEPERIAGDERLPSSSEDGNESSFESS